MVSDTWSTDVLASDSEMVEQQDKIAYPPSGEPNASILPTASESIPQAVLDVSETASEAWSTDVLASDSERLTEVDTDDTASVARYNPFTRYLNRKPSTFNVCTVLVSLADPTTPRDLKSKLKHVAKQRLPMKHCHRQSPVRII